jgi:hypothetical protein
MVRWLISCIAPALPTSESVLMVKRIGGLLLLKMVLSLKIEVAFQEEKLELQSLIEFLHLGVITNLLLD